MKLTTLLTFLAVMAIAVTTTGCTLMPEAIQPHQLWKLNRQPPSGRDDAFFSVGDPQPRSESFIDEAHKTAAASTSDDPFLVLDQ